MTLGWELRPGDRQRRGMVDWNSYIQTQRQTWACHWANDPCVSAQLQEIRKQPTALRAAEVFAVLDHLFGSASAMTDELSGAGRVCVHTHHGQTILVNVTYRVGDQPSHSSVLVSQEGFRSPSRGQCPLRLR